MLDATVAAAAAGGTDTTGLDRHTLVLQTDADALADDGGGHVGVVDATGRRRTMSAKVLRRLACEASLVVAVTDEQTPLDVGRRTRRPTAPQRRALLLRDRTCRFPGCGARRHLHAHHIRHWADDGPTDLTNLVTLCSFHHRFVHDHDWTIRAGAGATFRFTPPGHDTPLPPARPLADADDGWWFDPDHGRPLRPVHRDGPDDLDLDLAINLLHQELRHAIGYTDLAA